MLNYSKWTFEVCHIEVNKTLTLFLPRSAVEFLYKLGKYHANFDRPSPDQLSI